MNYASAKLEFSPDPLSDTTPSWIDVTRYCQAASWQSGKAKDLDDSQAGGATFVLRNDQRRFEPEYTAGAYYPNVVPLRRFRLTIVTAAGSVQQGIYYATSWTVSYPAGTDYSIVTVQAVDGAGILSLTPQATLDPPDAASIVDVYAADSPFGHFRLGEQTGTKMVAQVGTDGTYTGLPTHGGRAAVVGDPLVDGDPTTSLDLVVLAGVNGIIGKSKIDSTNNFGDENTASVEAVVLYTGVGSTVIVAQGPANGSGVHGLVLQLDASDRAALGVNSSTSGLTAASPAGSISLGVVHHICGTWDGHTARIYIDGVLSGTSVGSLQMAGQTTADFLYVGDTSNDGFVGVQDVAFYEYALSPERIMAHANAALNRGYAAADVGSRIAALAANPLWSTAGIAATSLTAAARYQTGQSTLDEIVYTAAAEKPYSVFYFDGSGNPAYYGWDDSRLITIAGVFGDSGSDTRYTGISVTYDDELYNQADTARVDGDLQSAADTTSQGQYYTRGYSASDLNLALDSDAARVAQTIVDQFGGPMFRVDSISLNGATPGALAQILNRQPGDTIEVRRLGSSGVPIDIITRILGRQLSIDPHGNLTCTWNLARGFNARTTVWRLGVNGFDELSQTTVLG